MDTLDEILYSIKTSKLSLIVGSANNCTVCDAIEPEIHKLLTKFSNLNYKHITVDSMKGAAGEFMIFAFPTIILFNHEKEIHRQGRFIDFKSLQFEIERWYEFLFSEGNR